MGLMWVTLSSVACAVIVFGLAVSAGVSDKLESDFFDNPETTVQLSHYFGNGDVAGSGGSFSPRGSVTIRNFKGPRFTTNQKDLTVAELTQLQNAANNGGYYFIKATVKTPSGEQSFRSFAYAKSMVDSGLSDILRLHLSPNGEIIAIGYSLARSDYMSAPNVLGSSRPPSQRFNTTVLIHHGEHGPVPDTAPYLEKLEQEKIAKERGEDPRDNRSFLAKYWMYIVPIAIMVLLSGASNPEEGGGGR